jgi:hypothetical protein
MNFWIRCLNKDLFTFHGNVASWRHELAIIQIRGNVRDLAKRGCIINSKHCPDWDVRIRPKRSPRVHFKLVLEWYAIHGFIIIDANDHWRTINIANYGRENRHLDPRRRQMKPLFSSMTVLPPIKQLSEFKVLCSCFANLYFWAVCSIIGSSPPVMLPMGYWDRNY